MNKPIWTGDKEPLLAHPEASLHGVRKEMLFLERDFPHPTITVQGYTARAAYLIKMDDLLFDHDTPEHPALVLLVLGKGEDSIELHIERGEKQERTVLTVPSLVTLLVRDEEI